MNIQSEIQDLVLDFFNTIGSVSGRNNGVYQITIPDKYQGLFDMQKITIAFERDISSKHDCELVIPGSKILLQIINICVTKGPIALIPVTGTCKTTIRYHFFVTFSGRSRMMMMDYVDIDMDTYPEAHNRDTDSNMPRWADSSKITSTYTKALKELKKRHSGAKSTFLDNANNMFQYDMRMFMHKYDSRMRDLDYTIKHKEQGSSDPGNTQEFRFTVADKIEDLEKEKERIEYTLQQKHRLILEYKLVACEVLSS